MHSSLQHRAQPRLRGSISRLLSENPVRTADRNSCFSSCQARVMWRNECWASKHSTYARHAKAVYVRCARNEADAIETEKREFTPLHVAAQRGNVKIVTSLLAHGADVNAKEPEDNVRDWGWTPLHHAVWNDHIDMAKLLLSHGADVNASDCKGATPLALTVCREYNPLTELLLLEGANPSPIVCVGFEDGIINCHPLAEYVAEIYDKLHFEEFWTPLHHAVHFDRPDTVRLLLAHGDIPDGVEEHMSPTEFAIVNGNLDMVKLLWPSKQNMKKASCYLRLASMCSEADIVEYLLSIGLDATETVLDQTPLHRAVDAPLPTLLDSKLREREGTLSLHGRQDFHASDAQAFIDTYQTTPEEFLSAAKADRLRIVRALLEHGADLEAAKPIPQQQDEPLSRYHTHQAGWTALHLAACNRSSDIIEVLCEHGANLEARTMKGRTALHHAAFHNQSETVKALLCCGADATARDNQGQTSMHSAASHDSMKQSAQQREAYSKSIKRTHPHRAINMSRNIFERLEPVDLDYQQTVATLIAHGADVSARDNQGLTPLHRAAQDNNMEMTKTLLAYGVDVNARTVLGKTPVHYAVETCNKMMTGILIEAAADVNVQDEEGCTPLHACAGGYRKRSDWYDHITTNDCDPADLAVFLLDHGANSAIKNQQGDTPGDVAVCGDDVALAQALNVIDDDAP